jgi:cytochrome oxidase Cu insertion factor (SCO1/SenC/PrrC family)
MKPEIPHAILPVLMFLLLLGLVTGMSPVSALEVGQRAPDFTLQSTTGKTISLSQFKGKKSVLLQFYSMDFNPS